MDPLFLEDFEYKFARLSEHWTGFGRIEAKRLFLESVPIPGVERHVLEISTTANTIIETRDLRPRDATHLARGDRLIIRLSTPGAGPGAPFQFRIFFSDGSPGGWWLPIKTESAEWREYSLPLHEFTPISGGIVPWEKVSRLRFQFSQPGRVLMDRIEILPGDSTTSAYLGIDRLRSLAFPGGAPFREHRAGLFIVATNSAQLDLVTLGRELEAMAERVSREFPEFPSATRSIPLIVFDRESEYREFWIQFSRQIPQQRRVPVTTGFSTLGFAVSWVQKDKQVRATLIHEGNHALMYQMLGITASNDWLQEGLAARYQLRYKPMDLRPIVRQALDNEALWSPLEKLLDSGMTQRTRYWQSHLFIEWLLADPGRRARLVNFIESIRRHDRADSHLVAKSSERTAPTPFGKSLAELEKDWKDWVRAELARGSFGDGFVLGGRTGLDRAIP